MIPAMVEAEPRADGAAVSQRIIRVMVVDDHEFFRSGVIGWLKLQQGILCCGEAASLVAARDGLARAAADIVLLDLGLPDGDGMAFIREAVGLHPGLRIIVLSQRDEAVFAERAMRNGASGYLMKSEAAGQLLEAIRAVMDGGLWLSRAAQAQADPLEFAVQLRQESRLGHLSDRELQVFALVGAGFGPKEVAARLGISAKTVETHREHVRHKLDLKDSAALARLAERMIRAGSV